METLECIKVRRSIRKYEDKPVPRELLEKILQAGIAAPSSKNRQPWRFVVATGEAKKEAVQAMAAGLAREKQKPFLPESAGLISGADYTLQIMQQAPALIFVTNALSLPFTEDGKKKELTTDERVAEICNAQSMGAAIENMTLAATALGLGSLWICDSFFAQEELSAWAGGELYAVLAMGYAAEGPAARPRRQDVIDWRG